MPDHGAIASAHESFAALLHDLEPRLLILAACAAGGVNPTALVEIRYRNPRLEVPALVKRAHSLILDLVYTTHDGRGRIVGSWIFEPQLSWDFGKRRRWALYELALEAEFDATAYLTILCPDPRLRRRFRDRLIPAMKTRPIVLEPDHVERITSYVEARSRPAPTVLGCLFHVHEQAHTTAVALFKAAWVAIQSLAEPVAQRYAVAVMSIVPANVIEDGAAELREEGELDEQRWELFTDIERKGHAFHVGREEGREEGREQGREEGREQGREEGREQGRADQLRRVVVDLLELHGHAPDPAARARITATTAVSTLEAWYAAARTRSGAAGLARQLAQAPTES